MAIRNIVKEGDPILNKVCRPVTNFDDRLATLLDDMRETMIAADGVGLAGPQAVSYTHLLPLLRQPAGPAPCQMPRLRRQTAVPGFWHPEGRGGAGKALSGGPHPADGSGYHRR